MRNLINFLLRHSSWIVLAIYVAISCVLLVGRNPYQRSIYLGCLLFAIGSNFIFWIERSKQGFAITKRRVGDGGNKSERTVESL